MSANFCNGFCTAVQGYDQKTARIMLDRDNEEGEVKLLEYWYADVLHSIEKAKLGASGSTLVVTIIISTKVTL